MYRRISFQLFHRFVFLFLVASAGIAACGGGVAQESQDSTTEPVLEASEGSERSKIVVLGDSLTAGYGLSANEAFPAILQKRLDAGGYEFEVINAGVSGDTTAGGLRRIDWILTDDVRVLILALGANDGLRGLPIDEMKGNLSAMIIKARERGVEVLLSGMEAPPNQGDHYTTPFRQAFQDLAREHHVPFMPFLLRDVGGDARFNQPDGIHPNAEGSRIIADNVWRHLEPMLAGDAS